MRVRMVPKHKEKNGMPQKNMMGRCEEIEAMRTQTEPLSDVAAVVLHPLPGRI